MQRTLIRLSTVAAVIVLVIVGGALLLDPRYGPSLGDRRPVGTLLPTDPDQNVPIEAGWYYVDEDGYRYTFHVPISGFLASPGRNVVNGSRENDPPDFAAFALLEDPKVVYTDPCHWNGTEATTGTTAADFVAAVSAAERLSSYRPGDTPLDGREAKRVRILVDGDVAFAECDENEYRTYEGRHYLEGAWQTDSLWILDLDNGVRAVFLVAHISDTRPHIQAALDYMVDSLHIEPRTP